MTRISESLQIVPAGEIDVALLDRLAARLARALVVSCYVHTEPLAIDFAYDPGRGQYYSTPILERLAGLFPAEQGRRLAVTGVDLFVPVLRFVFGEAQLDGTSALVSVHRLRDEFYGLPPRPEMLDERLEKEAIHELGHTYGLRHCDDWRCVMASSFAVERVDVKSAVFCQPCRRVVEAVRNGSRRKP